MEAKIVCKKSKLSRKIFIKFLNLNFFYGLLKNFTFIK